MYQQWGVCMTNKGEFMVCWKEGLTRGCWDVYKTYEQAYKTAKAMGFGREPIDEVKH